MFSESLAASHSAADLPIWREVYEKYFQGFRAMVDHREDGQHQRQGIDRSVILANSRQVLIDEKARGVNKKTGRVYRDIALEYWSDLDRKVPGWVCKDLLAEYIAYAIIPLGWCFMLPVDLLQRAWSQHGEEWITQAEKRDEPYWIVDAANAYQGRTWTTRSVAVPPKVLGEAIREMVTVRFEPIRYMECE